MESGANQHSLQRESLTLRSEKQRSLAASSHQHQEIFGNLSFSRAVHRQPHQQLVHLNTLIITSTQITRLKQDSMDSIFLPVGNLLKYKSCSSHVSPCWLMQPSFFQHCRHRISQCHSSLPHLPKTVTPTRAFLLRGSSSFPLH